jgi:cold shock CspA family protein
LETANHGLSLRSAELQHLMEEQEVSYKANMGAKQGEIKHLQVRPS